MSSAGWPAASVASSPWRSRSRMRGLPRDDETILRELGDKGVDHIGELPAIADDGALALIGGAVVEHLGDHVELGRAAKPVPHRLQLPHKLQELAPHRSPRPRIV